MKKIHQSFKNISENIHLTPEEKFSMDAYLSEYQALKPLSLANASAPQGMRGLFSFFSPRALPALALFLLVAGAAGASVAANSALPGDFLYPFKLSVNEKVSGAFAMTEEAKAQHETGLADIRLSEAETLLKKNTLSETQTAILKTEFSAHAENALEHIAKLKAADSETADSELSTLAGVLSTHEVILEREQDQKKVKLVTAIRIAAKQAVDANFGTTNADVHISAAVSSASTLKPGGGASTVSPALPSEKSVERAAVKALLQLIAGTSTPLTASSTQSLNIKDGHGAEPLTPIPGEAGNTGPSAGSGPSPLPAPEPGISTVRN